VPTVLAQGGELAAADEGHSFAALRKGPHPGQQLPAFRRRRRALRHVDGDAAWDWKLGVKTCGPFRLGASRSSAADRSGTGRGRAHRLEPPRSPRLVSQTAAGHLQTSLSTAWSRFWSEGALRFDTGAARHRRSRWLLGPGLNPTQIRRFGPQSPERFAGKGSAGPPVTGPVPSASNSSATASPRGIDPALVGEAGPRRRLEKDWPQSSPDNEASKPVIEARFARKSKGGFNQIRGHRIRGVEADALSKTACQRFGDVRCVGGFRGLCVVHAAIVQPIPEPVTQDESSGRQVKTARRWGYPRAVPSRGPIGCDRPNALAHGPDR